MKILGLFLCLFAVLDLSGTQQYSTEKEYEILNERLKQYNVNHPQPGGADVYVQIRFNSFGRLNAEKMEYRLDIILRQRWNDSRLASNDSTNTHYIIIQEPQMQSRIWKPDTYFLNVKDAKIHEVTMPNVLLRIEKTGEVSYVLRIRMIVECDLDLHHYPFDNQRCGLLLSSFSTNIDNIRFHWDSENPFKMPASHLIPQFDLYSNSTKERNFTNRLGTFSGLQVTYTLRRLNGYYLLHTYIPTLLIVTMSWISFWIDPNAVPGRVTLGVTTILTLTTLASSVGNHLPAVSYIKAIDIWLAVCMSMVYASLLEFTLVNFLANKKMHDDSSNKEDIQSAVVKKPTTYISQARAVDRLSRVFFPTSFFLFNIVYWPYYFLQLSNTSFEDLPHTKDI